MSKKGILTCILLAILLIGLLSINFFYEESYTKPNSTYQVYLDGEKIGLINSKDDLYSLINEEQTEIKEQYSVNQVYPPKGFQIVKKNTYNDNLITVKNVYDSIKNAKQFTIKGYTVTIKNADENVEPKYIYVLDKEIFEEAVENVIKIFIGEERYKQYTNDTQPEIIDTGYTIDNMYFSDKISIKDSYISVAEKIYTDSTELTKYLLFGENNSVKEYTVVQGDTIESIAEANQLNPEELLIANQELKTTNTLLAIGQKLNVALINPILSLTYEETVVEDIEKKYQTTYQDDPNEYEGYTKTTQAGVNGIDRITSIVQFTNGVQNQGGYIVDNLTKVIKAPVNEIIVKGTKKRSNGGGITGKPPVLKGQWYWPTNQPYIITSPYAYRGGTFHNGIDISGTGYKSPVYAALDGEVISSGFGGMTGTSSGCNVVIKHDNGYYTVYAHLATTKKNERPFTNYRSSDCDRVVTIGQRVTRGQRIGKMGQTGQATGVHLHFSVYVGVPYNGGYHINPWRLWQ